MSLRARTLLALHHATSKDFRRRLLYHMGRGQKPWQTPQAKANAQGRWDDASGWEYWSGGFSPSAGQVPWKARPQPKAGVRFPGFEDIVLPSSATAMPAGPPTSVVNVEEHRDAVLVSEVQAALNGARKAEQRVAKLRAQSATAMTKWQHFEAQMKAAFQKESERFVALKDRLSREIAEAEHAQQAARQLVRQTIAQEPAPMAVENATTDQIFDGWLKENDSHLSAVLQRCFGSPGARTPTRLRPGVPLSPSFHGKTQAHYVASQVQDPYFPSPEPGRMGCGNPAAAPAHAPGLIPGQGLGMPPMPATVPGDTGICATSGTLPPPGLGPGDELCGAAPPLARVAADVTGGEDGTYGPSPGLRERQARRRALQPFGLPTGRLPQANLEPNAAAAAAGRTVSFVADDGDESPGDLT